MAQTYMGIHSFTLRKFLYSFSMFCVTYLAGDAWNRKPKHTKKSLSPKRKKILNSVGGRKETYGIFSSSIYAKKQSTGLQTDSFS
jgi:hypothetical protein